VSADVVPTILGIVLVAIAAAFVLLPFARGAATEPVATDAASTDRFGLYQQVLEAEFDFLMGKLAAEDYHQQSTELLAQAGRELRAEKGSESEVDAEIEREIAAARAAFAAARRGSPAEAR
jgi:hypothetical protein